MIILILPNFKTYYKTTVINGISFSSIASRLETPEKLMFQFKYKGRRTNVTLQTGMSSSFSREGDPFLFYRDL